MASSGLFSRLSSSIKQVFSQAEEALRDPGQDVIIMLDDLEEQIHRAERDLHQMLVDRKVSERKLEELRGQEQGWQQRAEQALNLGDENLARAALARKAEITPMAVAVQTSLKDQVRLIEDMQAQVKTAKARFKALKLRKGSLVAEARAAAGRGGDPLGLGQGSPIDAIEEKIARLEALNELNQEALLQSREDAAVDAKIANLQDENSVDRALEELKAKLSGASPVKALDENPAEPKD